MRPFLVRERWRQSVLLVLAAVVTMGAIEARAGLRFASGPAPVALIELYTSEGCSSCPPAERWLGDLRAAPGLWRDFVPVAWHVDYWNRLGWPDRFSRKEFTQRQYAFAAAWRRDSVYTPCFVRNGEEWRVRGQAPEKSDRTQPAGQLVVSALAEGRWRADFTPAEGVRGDFAVHVAVLGGGFASKVTAGENRGATLRHEFVALALNEYPLDAAGESGARRTEWMQPKPAISDGERRALAVWVTRRGELVPLQATGGWLE